MVLPARSVFAIAEVASGEIAIVGEVQQTAGFLHANPRWSPDGNRFVFTLDHFDGDEYVGGAIAVIERTGDVWSEPTLITEVGEYADHPDWHPSDDLIVFCTYDYGAFFETDDPSNLYTIRPDGTERAQITSFGAGDERATQPSWTPDGRIIFTLVSGAGDGLQEPAFVNADGSGLVVVEGLENLVYPRLRPTGDE
jgi:Tol biopolymer transport system component